MISLYELLPHVGPITIVDVGASYVSPEPYAPLVKSGRAKVIAFEPDTAEREKLAAQNVKGRTVLNHFVGDGADATFYETNNALTGSLFPPNSPLQERFQAMAEYVRLRATHPVRTVRLDDIPEVQDIDLLKMDVQGAELAVLQGGERKVANAVVIYSEVEFLELYQGQPLFAEIDQHLRAQGFAFHTFDGYGTRCFKPLVAKGDAAVGFRQLLWADAIYIRNFMKFDALSTEKLEKLAIIANDVLGSPDVCHLALREVDARNHSNLAEQYLKLVTGMKSVFGS